MCLFTYLFSVPLSSYSNETSVGEKVLSAVFTALSPQILPGLGQCLACTGGLINFGRMTVLISLIGKTKHKERTYVTHCCVAITWWG